MLACITWVSLTLFTVVVRGSNADRRKRRTGAVPSALPTRQTCGSPPPPPPPSPFAYPQVRRSILNDIASEAYRKGHDEELLGTEAWRQPSALRWCVRALRPVAPRHSSRLDPSDLSGRRSRPRREAQR